MLSLKGFFNSLGDLPPSLLLSEGSNVFLNWIMPTGVLNPEIIPAFAELDDQLQESKLVFSSRLVDPTEISIQNERELKGWLKIYDPLNLKSKRSKKRWGLATIVLIVNSNQVSLFILPSKITRITRNPLNGIPELKSLNIRGGGPKGENKKGEKWVFNIGPTGFAQIETL